jgi:hypothetical protein
MEWYGDRHACYCDHDRDWFLIGLIVWLLLIALLLLSKWIDMQMCCENKVRERYGTGDHGSGIGMGHGILEVGLTISIDWVNVDSGRVMMRGELKNDCVETKGAIRGTREVKKAISGTAKSDQISTIERATVTVRQREKEKGRRTQIGGIHLEYTERDRERSRHEDGMTRTQEQENEN